MNDFFRLALIQLALDASIRIALVASCIGAILIVTRVRNGAVRHAGWTAVLCAMLLMPVLPNLTPEIEVRVAAPGMRWSVDTEPGAGQMMPAQQATESGPKLTHKLTETIEGSRPAP